MGDCSKEPSVGYMRGEGVTGNADAPSEVEPLPPIEGEASKDGPEFLRVNSDRKEPDAAAAGARLDETDADAVMPVRRSTDPFAE